MLARKSVDQSLVRQILKIPELLSISVLVSVLLISINERANAEEVDLALVLAVDVSIFNGLR